MEDERLWKGFTGFNKKETRELLEKIGGFTLVKNTTRLLCAGGGSALLITPDSVSVTFDNCERGDTV